METYDPQAIETRWQQVWEDENAFHTPNAGPDAGDAYYVLEMLPYPSGTLHVVQVRNYTQGDVLTHFHRRNGKRVICPMGFDSFGLNAENAAIRDNEHPATFMYANIAISTESCKRFGASFDWSRTLNTSDPEYYRWTQSLFLTFYERGLAYRKKSPVNWCPHQ